MDASRRSLFSLDLLKNALHSIAEDSAAAISDVPTGVTAPIPDAASGLLSRRGFIKSMGALAALVGAAGVGLAPSTAKAAPAEQANLPEPFIPDFQLKIVELAVAGAMQDSIHLYADALKLPRNSEEARQNAPLNLFVLMMHFGIAFETGQPVSSLANTAEFPSDGRGHFDQYPPYVTVRPGINVWNADTNGNPTLTEAGRYLANQGYNLNQMLGDPESVAIPAEVRRPLYFRTMLKHFAGLDSLLVQEWEVGLFGGEAARNMIRLAALGDGAYQMGIGLGTDPNTLASVADWAVMLARPTSEAERQAAAERMEQAMDAAKAQYLGGGVGRSAARAHAMTDAPGEAGRYGTLASVQATYMQNPPDYVPGSIVDREQLHRMLMNAQMLEQQLGNSVAFKDANYALFYQGFMSKLQVEMLPWPEAINRLPTPEQLQDLAPASRSPAENAIGNALSEVSLPNLNLEHVIFGAGALAALAGLGALFRRRSEANAYEEGCTVRDILAERQLQALGQRERTQAMQQAADELWQARQEEQVFGSNGPRHGDIITSSPYYKPPPQPGQNARANHTRDGNMRRGQRIDLDDIDPTPRRPRPRDDGGRQR